jgi:hypothetical protein
MFGYLSGDNQSATGDYHWRSRALRSIADDIELIAGRW